MSGKWLIGNLPPPVGGQSLITLLVVENIPFDRVINTSYQGIRSVIKILYNLVSIKFLHNTSNTLYIIPSRGRLTIWRELLFCVLWSGPVVAHMHGNDYHWILGKGQYSSFIRVLLRSSITKMICVNDVQQQDFLQIGVDSCVISNPVLLDAIDVSPSYNREFDFGFISVIMSSKGIFDSLDLFEYVLRKRSVRMIIAGPFRGDDEMSEDMVRKTFFKRVASINNIVRDSVIYIGEIHGDSIVRFYDSIKFLLFQSRFRSESFGLVLIEALSMGVIPIISNNPVLKSTLKEFYYLLDSDDIDSYLNIDMSLEIKENRKKVLEKYSKDMFLNKIEDEIYANFNNG